MTDVELVVPAHNEAAIIAATVTALRSALDALPFSSEVVVADNASTDGTAAVAGARYLRTEVKGRGHALRTAWGASTARVVAYADADLSTDLRALGPLLSPLLAGDADLAVGTRLHRDAVVVRGLRRELLSRGYNAILRRALQAGFSDAQCGFKAARRSAIAPLLEDIRDDGWFFDTELLVLAQRRGLRIREVPVVWTDDPDSRVRLLHTIAADLRGVGRLRRR